eukprot:scaffold174557_cov32-Tisochrysis_lutea.AAC.4
MAVEREDALRVKGQVACKPRRADATENELEPLFSAPVLPPGPGVLTTCTRIAMHLHPPDGSEEFRH